VTRVCLTDPRTDRLARRGDHRCDPRRRTGRRPPVAERAPPLSRLDADEPLRGKATNRITEALVYDDFADGLGTTRESSGLRLLDGTL
jgi:hypothetical protein